MLGQISPLRKSDPKKYLCGLCVSAVNNHKTSALVAAADSGVLAFDPGLNNIRGTADTRCDRNGVCGAIFGAGAAFHAAVWIVDAGLFIVYRKYAMRAYHFTHTAAHTGLLFEPQRCYPG